MPTPANYYEILGLRRYASINEVRVAFRHLAVKYHPDKNPGDKVAEEQFKSIANAYNTLGDEQKKRDYDIRLSGFYTYRQETPQEKRRKAYEAAMRRWRIRREREEAEIKEDYARAIAFMPYKWRNIISLLCFLSGLLLIIDNWFLYDVLEEKNQAFFIMFFGYALCLASFMFYITSLFKKWMAKSIVKPFRFDIHERIATIFILFIAFMSVYSITAPRAFKAYHLKVFGQYTEGIVINPGYVSGELRVYYQVNGKLYDKGLSRDAYRFRDVVVVKYSEKRPYIAEVVRRTSRTVYAD
jgi:curved DNA-binding protein CbpA